MKLVRGKKGYRKVGDKYLLAKKCTVCGRWLVASTLNFSRHKIGKYGLYSQCKECRAEYNRQYYQEHKDEITEKKRQWNKDNPDKVAEITRKYYQEHKDEIAEYKRQWRKDNLDKVVEYNRQWNKDNSDKLAEYHRQWKKDNPDKMAEYRKRQNKKRRQARIDAIIAQKRAEYEAERAPLVAEKTCKCCGRTLPASEFYANKKSKDHLGSYCKECHNKKTQENYYHNLETKGWA